MRVAVLATGWAGFNDAAFRLLAERGVQLLVVHPAEVADTAYTSHTVSGYAEEHTFRGTPDPGEIEGVVSRFRPDAVLVHSWHYGPYRAVLRSVPEGTLRVLWMDNVWRGTARQWLGRVVSPVWVQRLFDAVMVPGDRTEFFARRLGFAEDAVIRGSLSADTTLFGSPPRAGSELAQRRRFLACLRLVHHKGADVLAEAYRGYRELAPDPWGLQVAGIGELASAFEGLEGVEMLGFQQPAALAERMRAASCLVVPSRMEPYGVVVHEGAVSGLPILCTYFVGAAPVFVQDGLNGWLVPGSDAGALATAMARMSGLDDERLGEMSDLSRRLGARTSSAGWARHLQEQLEWRIEALRR